MNDFLLKTMFNGRQRLKTWRKMATLLKYDQPLNNVLLRFRNRCMERKSPLAKIFADILDASHRGEALDKAFALWIPVEETMLIQAGVTTSKLPEALNNCSDLIEAKGKIVQGLIGAITYPAVLLVMLISFVLFVALYIVPEISTLSDPKTWEGAAALLYLLASLVASPWGLLFFAFLAMLAVLILGSLPFWTGKWRLKVENLPPWSIYRLVVGSVWLFTVATMIRGGIQLEVIFADMLKNGNMHPWLRERVQKIKDLYSSASDLGRVFLHMDMHFPDDELVEDLAVYSALPNFHSTLYDIAKDWLDDGVKRIRNMSRVLNGILMLAIIFMAAWMAFAFRALQEQLMTGMGGF